MKDQLPVLFFETGGAWEGWLDQYHAESQGTWLKLAKKESGIPSIDYSTALDIALCYGWIDSQKSGFDDRYWLQRFTPRKRSSKWSKINCEHAIRLIAEGRMQPAGLKQVEQAQADGRWEAAYDSQSTIRVPPDFQSELDHNPAARDFFTSLNGANRYAILYHIQTAKKMETRAARIHKFIDMLARKEKLYD